MLDAGDQMFEFRVSLDQFVVLEDFFDDQKDGVFIFY